VKLAVAVAIVAAALGGAAFAQSKYFDAIVPGPLVFLSPMALVADQWNAPDPAVKVNETLILKIDGDRQLFIYDVNPGGWETKRQHRYVGWLAVPRFYVVDVSYADMASTYLIDARDGSVREIGAHPVLSPSGQLGIVWQQNFKDWPVGPYFIDFRAHPPTVIGVPDGPNCESRPVRSSLRSFAVWIDDSHVRFDRGNVSLLPGDDPNAKQMLKIVDGKPQWQC